MKKTFLVYPLIVPFLVLFLTTDCKKKELAIVSTVPVTNITQTTATSGGNITSDGGSKITDRGVCWSTTADPSISDLNTSDGQGPGQFVSNISELTAGITYHVRAFATNSAGTAYGNDEIFVFTVTDIDGNIYNTVTIGTQIWMKANLKTTKYNDGTAIPNITVNTAWAATSTGAYCDYGNTPANSIIYGRLYNWYALDNNAATKVASNGGKNVCPTGWHVPKDAEWTTLINYLTNNGYGYESSGSDIAKSLAATSGWTTDVTPGNTGNDQASNNRSGFTALPGGARDPSGGFENILRYCFWWSSTGYTTNSAYYLYILSNNNSIIRTSPAPKQDGFSVRCLKD